MGQNIKLGGSDMYILENGMEGRMKLRGPGNQIIDASIENDSKLQGKGTYSPDAYQSYRKKRVWRKGANLELKPLGILLESSVKTEKVEVPSESDKDESGSCFDLSLEEFPLLPERKRASPLKGHSSGRSTSESPPSNKSSSLLKVIDIKFGAFSHSPAPSVLSSPTASTLHDYDVSACADSMLGILTIAPQGPPKSSEINEETYAVEPFFFFEELRSEISTSFLIHCCRFPVQPCELQDDEDFPPLCH